MKALTGLWRGHAWGLATRIAVIILMALVALQLVSAAAFWVGRDEVRRPYPPRVLIRRIATIAQVVDDVPAATRAGVIADLDEPNLTVTLQQNQPFLGSDLPNPFADALRDRVRQALGDRNRPIEIAASNHVMALPPPLGGARPPPSPSGRLQVAVSLRDGGWLVFGGAEEGEWIWRMALWLVGAAVAIGAISILAARRIAAPFARFAAAAERLGLDPEAAPVPETGPRETRAAIAAFNRMQERLRRFVADRTQMLAAISHDLRTPLTRLRLRIDLVDDQAWAAKAQGDIEEMEAMIAATLAFARDEAKGEPRIALDLADLLQSLVEATTDAGGNAAYDGPTHFTYRGQPVALRRAIGNLIDNAVKYGGVARVALRVVDGHAQIAVDDDGPGLAVAELDRVFTPFYRVDRARNHDDGGGVGLGLSIARTVLRRHGGDVTLANRSDGGLRAEVSLPSS